MQRYNRNIKRMSNWGLLLLIIIREDLLVLVSSADSTPPSQTPSQILTSTPSSSPSTTISAFPSTTPSATPSIIPSVSNIPSAVLLSANPTSAFPSTTPSATPSIIPSFSNIPSVLLSANPTRECVDYDAYEGLWNGDWLGRDCTYYDSKSYFCDENSAIDYSSEVTPNDACCACGGGFNTTMSLPTVLPTGYPTISTPPTYLPSTSLLPSVYPSTFAPSLGPTNYPTTEPSASPSGFHSKFPSTLPSKALSSAPTSNPTSRPTSPLTRNPSRSPTAYSSFIPTFLPSTMPTLTLTSLPSRTPSRTPTLSPSRTPLRTPTSYPSDSLTQQPSRIASAGPTISMSPTWKPSGKPSVFPSSKPSSTPSATPSSMPTLMPSTPYPTANPSSSPSTKPSIEPTSMPTLLPSFIPTLLPSKMPSDIPTMKPSISFLPSSLPSDRPTPAPTHSQPPTTSHMPSSHPTVSTMPTLPTYTYTIEEVVMVIEGMDTIRSAEFVWQNVTASHISNYLNEIEFVHRVDVSVDLFSEARSLSTSFESISRMEEIQVSLKFDVVIEYQSIVVLNLDRAIEDAFRSSNSKFVYIDLLNEQSQFFRDVTNLLSVTVPSLANNNVPTLTPNVIDVKSRSIEKDDDVMSENEAIGIAIGSTAGVLLVFLIFLVRHSNKATENGPKKLSKELEEPVLSLDEPLEKTMLSRIIDVKLSSNDSVSNLEDPSIDPNLSHLTEDDLFSQMNSVATRSILPALDSTGSIIYGKGTNTKSLPSAAATLDNDSSLNSFSMDGLNFGSVDGSMPYFTLSSNLVTNIKDEILKISVGPGKLGLVIDSPDSGPPIVHAVKSSSVLFGDMLVGDRIVKFDDTDTTFLTAMQLTRIIAASFNKEERIFVIKRSGMNQTVGNVHCHNDHDLENQEDLYRELEDSRHDF